MSRLVIAALGLVFRIAIVLVVFEGLARLIGWVGLVDLPAPQPVAERAHTAYDPEIGWVSQPDIAAPDFYGPGKFLHTNARGFRGDREIDAAVPEGRVRLLCSGDSFTLGYGVADDETWCRRLEVLDARFETANLGQGGYGIDQSFLWWQRAAADLDYDVHLFAFILEDFARMEARAFLGYGKPKLQLRGGELAIDNVPVPRASYLWPWLTRNVLANQLRSVALMRAVVSGGGTAAGPTTFLLEESPALSMAVFETMAAAHASRGQRLLLVYLPVEDEFGDPKTDEFRAFLAEETARRGIPFLDLVEDLRRLPPASVPELFIPEGAIDFPAAAGHYTAEGNRRVAEWVFARAGGSMLRPLQREHGVAPTPRGPLAETLD